MTTKVELLTSTETYHQLHEIADGHKVTVKVNREVLQRLLIDHTRMASALHNSTSHSLIEPARPRRERPKLKV